MLCRSLLCNLVRVKLSCYELEGKNSLSLEDYLKAFMETEVKPLWPKGWMQARCVQMFTGWLKSEVAVHVFRCFKHVCLCSQDAVQREHHGSRSPHGLHVSHMTKSSYLTLTCSACSRSLVLFFFCLFQGKEKDDADSEGQAKGQTPLRPYL